MRYGEKQPILIKEREMQATQEAPVTTYKLTDKELEKYRKMGPIKKNAKKPIMLESGPRKKKMGVEKMGEEKQVKKLTMEIIKDCLSKGMTEKEIAEEYKKDERIVRMLIAKINKPTKKEEDKSTLKITSLRGLVEYHIDYKKDTVTIKNKTGNLKVFAKDVEKLIAELEELQKIIY